MIFSFPNTGQEFLVMAVPFLTLLLGVAHLISSKRILTYMGLEASPGSPEALGEGRSSFAGPLIAVSLGCLLLQDPRALQPGLNFMIAVGWSIASFGRVLQMVVDKGGLRKRVQVRLIIAIGMAIAAWFVTPVPEFRCFVPVSSVECPFPVGFRDFYLAGLALFTLLLGLIALILPNTALVIMKLQPRIGSPYARGESRGTLAGFHASVGMTYLLMPQPVDFVALVLGALWVFVGCGRLVSVVFDRGWTKFNVFGVILELTLGLLAIGLVLGMI